MTDVAHPPAEPSDALLAWLRAQQADRQDGSGWYGGGGLWTFPEAARYAYQDGKGALRIKMPWWPGRDEKLTIRLVSLRTGETVEGDVPGGYRAPGFQPTGLPVPYKGCWHITGTLGATQVRLVVDVKPFRPPNPKRTPERRTPTGIPQVVGAVGAAVDRITGFGEPTRRGLGQASSGDPGQPDSRRSKMAFSAARGAGSVPASSGISRT
ncbi:hypothetical protein AB0395_09160 [Streptosporangium sp. NPDC051023]|uniref:hypothetical protein n=1 Tax=Streptosporangium sp. NPDC051023 TaxID=3155410 RepID=UPI00344D1F10